MRDGICRNDRIYDMRFVLLEGDASGKGLAGQRWGGHTWARGCDRHFQVTTSTYEALTPLSLLLAPSSDGQKHDSSPSHDPQVIPD